MAPIKQVKEVQWVICDIEGTTTSISFVKDVLFPEARRRLVGFLVEHKHNEKVVNCVAQLWNVYLEDRAKNDLPKVDFSRLGREEEISETSVESFVQYYDWLMKLDRKVGPLKTLQGLIWKAGYDNGSIKGHIYPEVAQSFKNWTDKNLRLAIYSSGSVQAQKLLFANTESGDLTVHITEYFDTLNAGPKTEQKSYEIIAKKLNIHPAQALFLTDIPLELNAATAAGMKSLLVDRECVDTVSANVINDFTQLIINS